MFIAKIACCACGGGTNYIECKGHRDFRDCNGNSGLWYGIPVNIKFAKRYPVDRSKNEWWFHIENVGFYKINDRIFDLLDHIPTTYFKHQSWSYNASILLSELYGLSADSQFVIETPTMGFLYWFLYFDSTLAHSLSRRIWLLPC